MEARLLLPFSAVILTFAVVSAAVAFLPFEKGLVVEGVLIDASGNDPYVLFQQLSKSQVFLISPEMHEKAEAVDHEIFNATALFLQVVEGNRRKAVQVIRVHNADNELAYCLSNFGDTTVSEQLSKEDCLDYLSPENGAVILIQFPDESQQLPILEIGESRLTVKPKTGTDSGTTAFLSLRIMFRNSEEIIQRSNQVISGLST